MKFLTILFMLILSTFSWSQYTSVQQVPNPKSNGATNEYSKEPTDLVNGYVSNPDNIISIRDQNTINLKLLELENDHSFQVAIVAVNSIGNNVIEDFAVDLFALWGIGQTNVDNGLLVLFVEDQRLIRFETGDGTSTVLPDTKCYAIQQQYMVPFFKKYMYSEGLLQGVQGIIDVLEGKIIESTAIEVDPLAEQKYREQKEQSRIAQNAAKAKRNMAWLIGLSAWHAIGLIIFLIFLLFAKLKHDPYAKYKIIRPFSLWIWALFFPITHIFIIILTNKLKSRYRNMIRFSSENGEIMHKLTETEEDKYLSRGQLTEELVKSIDYDVWITEKSEDVLILAYKKMFSGYSKCPSCKFKTYIKVYDRTLVSPSYTSSGKGERKHECANCGHKKITTYRIAKLVKTSNTSSSRSSWSGSISGGGGGGSSWGGGSSSGGGATSGW